MVDCVLSGFSRMAETRVDVLKRSDKGGGNKLFDFQPRCVLNRACSWVLTLSLSSLSCRYYFKKASDEFECGAVFEEVSDDGSLLPTYEGKILGKVERME